MIQMKSIKCQYQQMYIILINKFVIKIILLIIVLIIITVFIIT